MNEDDLASATEPGVSELGHEWPAADRIYEVPIPRVVTPVDGSAERPIRTWQDYFAFLRESVFPLARTMEAQAGVRYWHILNHGANTDLRLLLEDEPQVAAAEQVLAQSGVRHLPRRKFGPYKDPGLGSWLGCQALMRLYMAQSRFVMELVDAMHWCKSHLPEEAASAVTNGIVHAVPIYTSHTLLNMFPADPVHEAAVHLGESYGRFRDVVDNVHSDAQREVIRGVLGDLEAAIKRLNPDVDLG